MKIKETNSKFLKVKCAKCKNEQIIFEKSATKEVLCLVCKSVIARSTGGKANIIGANVLKELN